MSVANPDLDDEVVLTDGRIGIVTGIREGEYPFRVLLPDRETTLAVQRDDIRSVIKYGFFTELGGKE